MYNLIIMQNKQKFNNNIDKIYKNNQIIIKKYCYYFSQMFNINYEDLLSESNEIFMNSIKKYYYNQISFNDFFRNNLKRYLKYYCLNEHRRIKKQELTTFKYYDNDFYELKLKQNDIPEHIMNAVNEMINFLIDPLSKNKLKPYSKQTKNYNIKNHSIYAVKNYFRKQYGYSWTFMNEVIGYIKLILKEEMI